MKLNDMAIVLAANDYRENDRMLTLFARDGGRVDALARGCRKITGKLHAAGQPFCCGEYSFSQTGDRLYVSSCRPIECFFGLHKDVRALAAGCVMLDACRIVLTGEGNRRLFALLTNALFAMDRDVSRAPEQLCFFVIKLHEVLGFRPEVSFSDAADALCERIYSTPPKYIQKNPFTFPLGFERYCCRLLEILLEHKPKSLGVYEQFI